ncbi:MAG TPA: hypothetical protein VGP24_02925 [Glaciihabitans sp.]|jgi:hypothetical protein|nr:hypothetical protein [Glaciihabitans sp.]
MRFFLTTLAVFVGVLLIAGFVFFQVAAQQDANRATTETSESAPTASARPTLTPEETREQDIVTKVNLYGQLVCNKLAENPGVDLDPLIDRFITTYGVSGDTPEQQLETAHRLLLGATEKYCTDQTARVTDAVAAG